MQTIGIIGGLSWEATALYYRLLNEGAARALGPNHNARSVVVTVDFAEALALAEADRWADFATMMIDAGRALKAAGAEMLLLAANTAHLVADEVAAKVDLPLLHIVDVAGAALTAKGVRRVGLLATRFTLEAPLFPARLKERFGIEAMLPPRRDWPPLQAIITEELTRGRIEAASRQRCRGMIEALAADGAEAILLACTELPLLLRPEDSPVPLYDTTALHVDSALRLALAGT